MDNFCTILNKHMTRKWLKITFVFAIIVNNCFLMFFFCKRKTTIQMTIELILVFIESLYNKTSTCMDFLSGRSHVLCTGRNPKPTSSIASANMDCFCCIIHDINLIKSPYFLYYDQTSFKLRKTILFVKFMKNHHKINGLQGTGKN